MACNGHIPAIPASNLFDKFHALCMYTYILNILLKFFQRQVSTPKSYCTSNESFWNPYGELQIFGDEVQQSSTQEVQNIPLTSCRGRESGHPLPEMDIITR